MVKTNSPESPATPSLARRLKNVIIGGARSPTDKHAFHNLSLVALLAWVGLGADGLSSSCYGPPEAFMALKEHPHLAIFVALASAITIFVISSSYSQLIELFPAGGGGYVVASKLLSPTLGMIAGCALLVDYALTITVSVAAGVLALLSFFPESMQHYKLTFGIIGIIVLMIMNLRGVKESVTPLVPIFGVFVLTHIFVIVYALAVHGGDLGRQVAITAADVRSFTVPGGAGLGAMILLIMHAYSMGAGTYTGIEAVSNGLPILREPRVQTGKRAMTYMWISLAVASVGLMLAYLLFNVTKDPNKTLNATLLENLSAGWSWGGPTFVIVTLVSEAALLFVAAQTGFLGGPRVLAYMAMDRWFPARLSMLSDRLVTQNGVILMSLAAIITMWLTDCSVTLLVILYSINVFITFLLSQTGMVKHWWTTRGPHWKKKIFISGVGAMLTLLILVWVIVSKFLDGGWVTLLVTGALITVVCLIRRHYQSVGQIMQRLNKLTDMVAMTGKQLSKTAGGENQAAFDPKAKTAVLLVNGFNGFGMHTLLNILRFFGDSFRNFVFVQVGVVDAGNFKGVSEVTNLDGHIHEQVDKYIEFVRQNGYYGEGMTTIGTDVVDQLSVIAPEILAKYPDAVFFGGQLVFPKDNWLTRLLHNNITFAIQRRLYRQGIPFVILPIRV